MFQVGTSILLCLQTRWVQNTKLSFLIVRLLSTEHKTFIPHRSIYDMMIMTTSDAIGIVYRNRPPSRLRLIVLVIGIVGGKIIVIGIVGSRSESWSKNAHLASLFPDFLPHFPHLNPLLWVPSSPYAFWASSDSVSILKSTEKLSRRKIVVNRYRG